MAATNNQLINDYQCERIVLGTIMREPNAYDEAREILHTSCFYNSTHKEIWEAITTIKERGDNLDILLFHAQASALGKHVELSDLLEMHQQATYCSVIPYAMRLNQLARQRKAWEIGCALTMIGCKEIEQEELDKSISNVISQLEYNADTTTRQAITLVEATNELYKRIAINNNKETATATPTGFAEIDRRGGLQPNTLIILAGETSMGKTSLANAIALNAIEANKRVLYFSMEMTHEELAARFLSMKSGVPTTDILFRPMDATRVSEIAKAEQQIRNEDNLFIEPSSTTNADTILANIHAMYRKHKIDGVIIDYLQILNVNTKTTNKEQAMAEVARKLKNIAKELGIWVIALSQLSRSQQTQLPNLNRLRDSGQIAEAADVVMFVYRPEVYADNSATYPEPFSNIDTRNTAMIDIAKGRNIGRFRFLCKFIPELTLYREAAINELHTMQRPSNMAKTNELDTPF